MCLIFNKGKKSKNYRGIIRIDVKKITNIKIAFVISSIFIILSLSYAFCRGLMLIFDILKKKSFLTFFDRCSVSVSNCNGGVSTRAQIAERSLSALVGDELAIVGLEEALGNVEMGAHEAASLSIGRLGGVEHVKGGRTRRIVAHAALVRHLLDESRPALTHVEQLDAFALDALQVELLHVRVHGHDLVEGVDGERAQIAGHALVGGLERGARVHGALVDVVEALVVELLVELGDQVGVGSLAERDVVATTADGSVG